MSNTKHLNLKDFEKSEIIGQVYAPSLMKGRGKEKLIGELDKAGKNVKTANGWVPVKGNEHLVTGGHISDTGTTRWSLKDFKVDSLIHFNDGEVWQVVKESTLHTHDRKKDDGIKIKPYNELAKKRNTSLQINVDLEYLNKNATKVVSATETKTEVSVHPDIQNEHLITGGHKKEKKKYILVNSSIGVDERSDTGAYLKNKFKEAVNGSWEGQYNHQVYFETDDLESVKKQFPEYRFIEHIKKTEAKIETKKETEVHSDIKEAIEHYKGGTIPSEVLIHLATKYASKQPTEVFHNVHGAQIRVYGKEGNNYAINFGGAKGITLATEADMNTMRGKKKEVVTEIDEKQNKMTNKKPTFQLSGTDGNVFAIISKVSDALKRAGQADNAKEFMARAFKAGSYDEVLQMVHEYVNAK